MEQAIHLTGLSPEELRAFVEACGEPAFRARQIFSALHRRRLRSFDEMTDLPKDFRALLAERATAATLTVESRYIAEDGTRRYLLKTHDNLPVEAVFIPEERRDTICFSSQSGCPLQCDFCLTAKLGLLRTLTAGEIVEQIIIALNDAYGTGTRTPRGTNLVAMGAGEPFLAFESLMKALGVMAEPEGLHIVPNRVTVSTAGVVPRIRELAGIQARPHLAISLAAPTDELRNRLMPINKKWPLDQLLAACKEFEASLRPGERFTFEYVMLDGVNDSDEHARQLANLLNRHGLQRAKVNMIPHNPADPLPYRPSTPERVESFKAILEAKGIHAFVRRPRGRDIYAACGQLAARRDAPPAEPKLYQLA
ncbi:MAG TPA: 23S rRNA (adenine(2503)-C(2))-methyltransferase RlmN [Pyrinomonadaceae bacterium]|jgi:23S rRNA (adenine2503-C2)-methyltransferase|nr:23S rRNA (adenine(2503)-C(2))-methyltransferase RlmN [Pyrinomonadaceae bacterium]